MAAALISSKNCCPHDVYRSISIKKCALIVRKGCVLAELHLGKVGKVATSDLETEV